MTTSCHRHKILDGGGSTPFGQTYFQACQSRQSPVLAQVISPALELKRHLHIDVDGIKREEDWEPIMKALRKNEDLKEIRLRSNLGPGMQGIAMNAFIDINQGNGSGGASGSGSGGGTSSDNGDEGGSMSTTRAVKLNYATQKGLPEALRRKDKVTRGSNHVRMGRVAIKLVGSIKDCLIRSNRITVLEIAGVYLTIPALDILQKGLACNGTIKELSLARSNIGDDGLFTLIPGIKAAKALCSVNLSACQLTPKGADFLSNLIKSQAVQRQAAHWVSTLRAHPLDPLREGFPTQDVYNAALAGPTLDMPLGTPTPIRRFNLCCNSLGDNGLDILMDGLVEEIGMLAIDLQYNDITDAGGRIVEQVVRLNGELVIVDLRNNQIDPILMRIITSLLHVNMTRRLKAGAMPTHSQSKLKMDQPQPIEWLSESHPLESTFHSTSTTATSTTPYECVRSSIRKANVLNHLRRHTSSSIKKLNFASTKDAEAELRRKRRKWDEVEAAAKIRIPKGNLYPQNTTKKVQQPKQKDGTSATKIPGLSWLDSQSAIYDSDNTGLEDVSHRLNLLVMDRQPTLQQLNGKDREYSTPREAQLWAENQSLKEKLNHAQQHKSNERKATASSEKEWFDPRRREYGGWMQPKEQSTTATTDNPKTHAKKLNSQKNTKGSISSDSLKFLVQDYCEMADEHSTMQPAAESNENSCQMNPLDEAVLNGFLDLNLVSNPTHINRTPNLANAVQQKRSFKTSISLDKLAAELDAFIQESRNSEFVEPVFEVCGEVEIEGLRQSMDQPNIKNTIKETMAAFLQSPDANQQVMADILSTYMGMSSSTLGFEDAVNNIEMLKAVDDTLSDFMNLLEDIERCATDERQEIELAQ
ncbi:hypothetical protein BDR26DRAFT_859221 [Obelidium mucronatum]|nr:hypothetical protein BDR26DRAFT_859221 [Obelidium mucronatum]